MALFKIFKGNSENLGHTGGTDKAREGYAYFTPDDGKFYIDIANSDEVIVGDCAKDGANRICINSSIFDNDHVLFDCGTAAGWVDPTSYVLDGGDSDLSDEVLTPGS